MKWGINLYPHLYRSLVKYGVPILKGSVIRPLRTSGLNRPRVQTSQFCQNGSFKGMSVLDTPTRPILGRVLYSLFAAAQFLKAFNNVSLSSLEF